MSEHIIPHSWSPPAQYIPFSKESSLNPTFPFVKHLVRLSPTYACPFVILPISSHVREDAPCHLTFGNERRRRNSHEAVLRFAPDTLRPVASSRRRERLYSIRSFGSMPQISTGSTVGKWEYKVSQATGVAFDILRAREG